MVLGVAHMKQIDKEQTRLRLWGGGRNIKQNKQENTTAERKKQMINTYPPYSIRSALPV